MKSFLGYILIIFLFPFQVIANDVNNDSKVGVDDAITALQVASGIPTQIYLPKGLLWQGKWSPNSLYYNKNDMVEHEGSSYICIIFHISDKVKEPTNIDYWQLIAKGGQGPKGETGPPGLNGKDGFPPEHEWNDSSIRFKKPDNSWGNYVNLKGDKGEDGSPPDHEWNENAIRFKKPDGTWGEYINLNTSTNMTKSNTLSLIAGEPLMGAEEPVPVYLSKDGLIIQQIENNSNEIIFGVNKFLQTFTTDLGTTKITNISLNLEKLGSPEGDLIVSLHTINQGNIPENTSLTQTIVTASSIQDGWNNFTLSTSVMNSSKYAIVVSVPNGDSSNYIKWKKSNTNIYPEGRILRSTNFGFDWSELNNSDFCFQVYGNNRVYACRSSSLEKLDFIGFVITNANPGENVIVQVDGIVRGFDNLQVGKKYFIQDNSGIGVVFGSYKKLAGIALNEKDLSIFWSDSLEFATTQEAIEGINDYKILSPNILMQTILEKVDPVIQTIHEKVDPLKYMIRKLIPSDTLRVSANTEAIPYYGNKWCIVKQIRVNLSGRIRVKFKYKSTKDNSEFKVQTYINIKPGDTVSTTSLEYVSHSYEISVEPGYSIDLQALGRGKVCCLGLYWDIEMVPPYSIITN